MSNVNTAPLDTLLQEAKKLLQAKQLGPAIAKLSALLEQSPSHRDGLYYLAVSYRQNRNLDSANVTLEFLLSAHPHYGRAHQEKGHSLIASKQPEAAAESYAQAVSLNPALIASWKALVLFYDAIDKKDEAKEAMRHAQWLAKLPPELLAVSSLIYEEKFYIAEQLCRGFLKKHPHHGEAMRLLAEIGTKLQILDDAEFLLESCVEFYPDYHRARADYVSVLHKRQKFAKALEQAQKLHAIDPNNISFEVTLASETQAVGDFDKALEIYDRVLSKHGDQHSVFAARGHALKTVGKTEDAIESYRSAYKIKVDFGDAYWSLANLKTYKFSQSEIDQMREQQAKQTTSSNDRVHMCFALGKAYEDRAEFSESFDFYQRGNAIKHQSSQYKPERLEKEFEQQKELFNADFFEQRLGQGCSSSAPIFIVGLPRSGSTLLEQILASHSQVDGTMELANIIGLAHRLGGRRSNKQAARYPAVLADLDAEQLRSFGDDFINDTQIHRQGAAFFIDKMPNNFRHIALIKLILPNAKIIDARREPMACCFSGFKQLFAEGQEFSYGLDLIGRYYKSYVDIMSHWEEVLPGAILRVQHENVLDDLELQVRRILEYCELPFEAQCLEFHKTERAVRTPSSEQVRQPIFKTAVQQWQHYEQYLPDLKENLGAALTAYK
ncbi:MAG: tetratricopeptide (TPR) repeat protein [Cryomorphaceae bacterium]|jgi:tetratricopeptide (TPR) repeat protein